MSAASSLPNVGDDDPLKVFVGGVPGGTHKSHVFDWMKSFGVSGMIDGRVIQPKFPHALGNAFVTFRIASRDSDLGTFLDLYV